MYTVELPYFGNFSNSNIFDPPYYYYTNSPNLKRRYSVTQNLRQKYAVLISVLLLIMITLLIETRVVKF